MRRSLLFTVTFFLIQINCFAEGSKNLTPQGTESATGVNQFIGYLQHDDGTGAADNSRDFLKPGAPDEERLKIFLRAGETLYYGVRRIPTNTGGDHGNLVLRLYSTNNTVAAGDDVEVNTNTLTADTSSPNDATFVAGPGVIATREQVTAGPAAVVGASGYNALSYTNNTGVDQDFYIVFDQQAPGVDLKSWYDLWDFSVYRGTEEQTGRLHAKTWSITAGGGSNRLSTEFQMYAAVPSEINGGDAGYFIKELDISGIQPFGLLIYSNSTGNTLGAVGDLNGDGVEDFQDARRSLDNNDNTVSEYDLFITNPDIQRWPTSELPNVSISNVVFFCDALGNGNAVIGFETNQVGEIAAIIDLNGISGYQPNTVDVIIERRILTEGYHEVRWNGIDGNGDPVPAGTFINISGRFTSGPTHFPLWDVEVNSFEETANPAGIRINDLRPTTSFDLIYWDDSEVTIGSSPLVELNGTNNTNHFWNDGDQTLVNTWSYGYYQINSQSLDFDYVCDTDGDGINDALDLDSDNDGIPDTEEGDYNADADGDGIPDYVDTDFPGFIDTNNDGINDNFDDDLDGVPNALDLDSDNDGIPDMVENGLDDTNDDGTLAGDGFVDDNNNGLDDRYDPACTPCGAVTGTALPVLDKDGDTVPNYLDIDADNDGIVDVIEAGGTADPATGQIAGYTDTNNNGLNDEQEISGLPLGDFDNDGIANYLDIDSDNDGIRDNIEAQQSSAYIAPDASGFLSSQDDNQNGLLDAYDPLIANGTFLVPVNTDGSGNADYIDLDADEDGVPDFIEGWDSNFDGYADLDTNQDGQLNDSDVDAACTGRGILRPENGDFEQGLLYLDSFSGDVFVTNDAQDGDAAIGVGPLEGGTSISGFVPALPGQEFNFSGFARLGGTPGYTAIGITFWDIDKAVRLAEPEAEVTTGTYANYSFSATAPANTAFVEVRTFKTGNTDTLFFDNFSVTLTTCPVNYADVTDEDGLLDIFESFNARLQNTDRSDEKDWQDANDDNDKSPTSGEDVNNNGNWADDFSQGGVVIPDYLFAGDYDGDAVPDKTDADSDNDGIPDNLEKNGQSVNPGEDSDNDGIPNFRDPGIADQLTYAGDINGDGVFDVFDSDLDGIPDFLDLDSDNDGIFDAIEANNGSVPFGLNQTTGQFQLQDPDNDGLMNYVDADDVVRNTKNNAISDLAKADSDGDGIRDDLDIDSDNDGIVDNREAQTSAGYIAPSGIDDNANGMDDAYDPGQGGQLIVPVNTDGQDLQDYLDDDSDNDSYPDVIEGDDADSDGYGKWDANQDGIAQASEGFFIDTNSNGIPDGVDAALLPCTDANTDGICDDAQDGVDSDRDGIEDSQDPDIDNDGLVNAFDTVNLNLTGANNAIGSNADLQNTDGTDEPDWRDTDDDNDGIPSIDEDGPNGVDPVPAYLLISDFDRDGVDDINDLDSDNDGILDTQEGAATGVDPSGDDDADGIPNFRDSDVPGFVDVNNDGVDDRGDKDLDGIPNFHDLDSDNDGIPDAVEGNKGVIPANMNANGQYPTQYVIDNDDDNDGLANDVDIDTPNGRPLPNLDTDGDGLFDFLDLDSDNDGLPDIKEVNGIDADGDGKVDDPTDTDADGLADVVDPDNLGTPYTIPDTDGDLVADYRDVDSDNDGITDPVENGQPDTDGNGKIDGFSNDADNDGLADRVDPDSGGTPVQDVDSDEDGIPDHLDLDSDNDALSDIYEGGGEALDTDNDGKSDNLLDTDGDGIPDSVDVTQTGGSDDDGDGIDNAFDADIDGDGIPNNHDIDQAGGTDTDADGIVDAVDVDQTGGVDLNGDGIDDALFVSIDDDNDGIRNSFDPDANGDGYDDAIEADPLPIIDTDGDGFKDFRDLDADNDGIVDVIELGLPADVTTGKIDGFAGNDANNTGWHDAYEGAGNAVTPPDTDDEIGDVYFNAPDHLDIDADNDGIPDNFEAQTKLTYIAPVAGDTDQDGLLDVYDPDNGGTLIQPVDTDGDTTPDYLDDDSDDDNVPDAVEGDNLSKRQFAGWDTGSNNDPSDESGYKSDVDADGLWDLFDEYPGNGIPNITGTFSAIQDSDRDKVWDFQDADDDNDGLATSSQGAGNEDRNSDGDPTNDLQDDSSGQIPNYLFGITDHDGDGIDDVNDLDSDNDGLIDTEESGGSGIDPSGDIDGDGLRNFEDPDMDGDGIINRLDPDVDNNVATSQVGLTFRDRNGDGVFDIFDKDLDGVPDYLDIDSDNDGIADIVEFGLDDTDGDGTLDEGSGITDVNGNGLDDAYDPDCAINTISGNADAILSQNQIQNASNALGNNNTTFANLNNSNSVLDLDLTDEVPTGETIDIVIARDGTNQTATADVFISTDGINFSANGSISTTAAVGSPITINLVLNNNARYIRFDRTGNRNLAVFSLSYSFDANPCNDVGVAITPADTDSDGILDHLDLDSDNDGIPDIVEAQTTAGYIAPTLVDANGNGRADVYDTAPVAPVDTDTDGTPDYLDTDADNDGVPDNIEGFDANSNGFADWDTNGDNLVAGEAGAALDQDKDGILFIYDSYQGLGDLANINNGSRASLQDTDAALDPGTPDWRDADDDGDGIDTQTEDNTPGANAPDVPQDFTQGGTPIPDYLFNPDKDGDGVIDSEDLDSDNDGVLNTVEYNGAVYFDNSEPNGGTPFGDADGDGIYNYLDDDDVNNTSYIDENGDGVDDQVDKDRDGIPNFFDLDSDNDGIMDAIEANSGAVPSIGGFDINTGTFTGTDGNTDGLVDAVAAAPLANPDSDSDTINDFLDLDSDNDGITDHVEGQTTADYSQPSGVDSDRDGLDDAFDGNNGGTPVTPVNTDGAYADSDAIPDYLDIDSDNDSKGLTDPVLGIRDIIEGFDANRNGFSELDTDLDGDLTDEVGWAVDSDNDGLWDIFDSFSGFGRSNILGSRADLQDTDGDGIPDWRDFEDDNDGIISSLEDVDGNDIWTDDKRQAGGATPDYLFFNDTDKDGIADGFDVDSDNDGIPDKDEQLDNTLPLPLGNEDNDEYYNYLDPDLSAGFVDANSDGVNDLYDFDLDGVPNALDLDSDNDGIPDAVEANSGTLPTGADANGQFPPGATDGDNDGLVAAVDTDDTNISIFDTTLPIPDTDGDGNPDFLDIDSDNDGIVDLVEAGGTDFNGDGRVDAFGDTDGDGLANTVDGDNGGSPLPIPNTDGAADGPDYLDKNSDNDSLVDADEGFDDDEDGGSNDDYLARATAYNDPAKYPDSDLSWLNDFLQPGSPNYYDTDGDGLVDFFDPDNGGNWYGNVSGIPDNDNNGIPNVLDNDGSVPLPLTWLSFDGWYQDFQIDLSWKTTDEDNVSHFEIEWSEDGKEFTVIGQVSAANTFETVNTYGYVDRRFTKGFNYYRVNQVDFDGASDYSETISVLASGRPFSIVIYPNPAMDFIRVEGSVPLPLGHYVMYDLSGRKVMEGNTVNVNRLNLDIRHLNTGFYQLIVDTPVGVYKQKLLKK